MLSSCASENHKWEGVWKASCHSDYFVLQPRPWKIFGTVMLGWCLVQVIHPTCLFSVATTGQGTSGISCCWVRDETWEPPSLHSEHLRHYNLISPVVTSPTVCCPEGDTSFWWKCDNSFGWPTAFRDLWCPVLTQSLDSAALDPSGCSDGFCKVQSWFAFL